MHAQIDRAYYSLISLACQIEFSGEREREKKEMSPVVVVAVVSQRAEPTLYLA